MRALSALLLLVCGCMTRHGVDDQHADEWQRPHPDGPRCEVLLECSKRIEGRVKCEPHAGRYVVTQTNETLIVPFERVTILRVTEFPKVLDAGSRAASAPGTLSMVPKHAPTAVAAADLGKPSEVTSATQFTAETAAKHLSLSPPVRLHEFAHYVDGGSIGITLQDWAGRVCCLFEDHGLMTKTGGRIFVGGRKPNHGKESTMLSVEEGLLAKRAAHRLAVAWLRNTYSAEEQGLLLAAKGPRRSAAFREAEAYFCHERRQGESRYGEFMRRWQFNNALAVVRGCRNEVMRQLEEDSRRRGRRDS